ncbi:hypothetical protein ACVWZT_004294 [Pseudomonas sp. TE21394]
MNMTFGKLAVMHEIPGQLTKRVNFVGTIFWGDR